MKPDECIRFNDCEKVELIKTIDTEKYDVDALIGDICWLCDKKINKGEIGDKKWLITITARI